MTLFSGFKKKKNKKRRDAYCKDAEAFIQVHFVRERDNSKYAFNTLSLKSDPDRDKCEEWYRNNGNPSTYSAVVTKYISEGRSTAEALCQKANFESAYFDKLRQADTYIPGKGEAVAVCFGLKLNFEETRALLKTAGYALTNSSKADLIIRYFIINNIYLLSDLNYVLNEICSTKLKDID